MKKNEVAEGKRENYFRQLTLEQVDEIIWKIQVATATLNILTADDAWENNSPDCLQTLAIEAHSRLEEARGIIGLARPIVMN